MSGGLCDRISSFLTSQRGLEPEKKRRYWQFRNYRAGQNSDRYLVTEAARQFGLLLEILQKKMSVLRSLVLVHCPLQFTRHCHLHLILVNEHLLCAGHHTRP